MGNLVWPALNLSILIGYLVYVLRTPFKKFITSRHEEISTSLNKSKIQAAEAEVRRKEIEAKFSQLSTEKEKIVVEWKEKEALQIKATHESSQRILNQMKNEAEQNKRALQESIRSDVLKDLGALLASQAETKIKAGLNPESHRRINDGFAKEVVTA